MQPWNSVTLLVPWKIMVLVPRHTSKTNVQRTNNKTPSAVPKLQKRKTILRSKLSKPRAGTTEHLFVSLSSSCFCMAAFAFLTLSWSAGQYAKRLRWTLMLLGNTQDIVLTCFHLSNSAASVASISLHSGSKLWASYIFQRFFPWLGLTGLRPVLPYLVSYHCTKQWHASCVYNRIKALYFDDTLDLCASAYIINSIHVLSLQSELWAVQEPLEGMAKFVLDSVHTCFIHNKQHSLPIKLSEDVS